MEIGAIYTYKHFEFHLSVASVSGINTSTPSSWSYEKTYSKSCKKLGVDPVQCISKALRRGQEVKVQNRVLDALEMLCLTNALVVRRNENFRSTSSCMGISSAILLVDFSRITKWRVWRSTATNLEMTERSSSLGWWRHETQTSNFLYVLWHLTMIVYTSRVFWYAEVFVVSVREQHCWNGSESFGEDVTQEQDTHSLQLHRFNISQTCLIYTSHWKLLIAVYCTCVHLISGNLMYDQDVRPFAEALKVKLRRMTSINTNK